MIFDIITLSLACVANLLLGALVFARNPRSRQGQAFLILILSIVAWSVANYAADHLNSEIATSIFTRLTFVTGSWISLSLWLFSRYFPRERPVSLLRNVASLLAYIIVGAFAASPLVVTQVAKTTMGASPTPGPLYLGFLAIFLGGVVAAFWNFFHHYSSLSLRERIQIKFVTIGVSVSVVLGLLLNVILPLLLGSWASSHFGPLLTVFFVGTITYSIVRHRFMDIQVVVARSITYLLLLAALGTFYGLGVFAVSRFVLAGTVPGGVQNIASTSIAIILAFTFQPLRRFFEKITNKIFYRYTYDSEAVLNGFSKIMVSELDLNRILKRSLTQLCESLHIQFSQLVIFDNDRVYRVEHYGELPRRLMVAPELAKLDKAMIIADELEGGERKHLMEEHSIRVSIMLRTRDEFIGYLLLGDKLSGGSYSGQDVKLLEIVASELAVAISNAKAYAQIQEFNLTLQARVDHATNRLRVANRHLKELDHAKDEFISMASHQLRTPLTTIKGYLSMMQEGDAGKLTKAQQEFVGYAFGSSERMVNLISDLLNVSRLSAGRFLIQTKPTDMVRMIADEVRQLQTHATAKHIALIFDPPPETLPPVEIDENKTRQVIMNFIDNAIYYTKEGEVRVVLEQSGDHVRLEVRDTGIGVPEKARKKLFSKFFRADNAQVVRPDGTGLGLYLAKRVVEDQGGTIIFSSVEGKGSTFGFELPFKPITPIREVPHARKHKPHQD